MVWNLAYRLMLAVVHIVDGLLLCIHSFSLYESVLIVSVTNLANQIGIICNHLSDDIASALNSLFCCLDFLLGINKRFSSLKHITALSLLHVNYKCQWLKPLSLGLSCSCGLLLLKRLIQILNPLQNLGFLNLCL